MKKHVLLVALMALSLQSQAGVVQSEQKIQIPLDENLSCQVIEDNTGYLPWPRSMAVLLTKNTDLASRTLLSHPELVLYGQGSQLCDQIQQLKSQSKTLVATLVVKVQTDPNLNNPDKLFLNEGVELKLRSDITLRSSNYSQADKR